MRVVVEPSGGILGRILTRRIWREGAWVAAGQAVTGLAGFAALKILTTLLSVDDYGRFALVFGVALLGTGVVISPILQAVLRFYSEALQYGSVGALRAMTLDRMFRGVLILSVALVLGGAVWKLSTPSRISLISCLLAAGFVAADAVRGLEVSLLNAARRQRDQAIRGAADAVVRPLAACAAIALLGRGPSQVILGYLVGSVLVSVVLRNRIVRGEADPRSWRENPWVLLHLGAFLRYALPLAPLAALNWVMSLGDRYLLAGITGASAVGVYAAAYALASQPLIAISQFVHATLRPVLYDALTRGDAVTERRVLRASLMSMLTLATVGTAIAAVLAPWLTRLVLGPQFGAAAALLPWIAGAYGLQALQHTFELMMYAHGLTRRLMALQVVAASVALALYILLIPRYGALGAAWGTLATMFVTCVTAAVMASAPRRLFGPVGA